MEATDKSTALADGTVNLQRSVMPLQGVFDNGKTKPWTPGFTGMAAIHPIETLGQARNMSGVYTNTVIFYGHTRLLANYSGFNPDINLLRFAVFDGIK